MSLDPEKIKLKVGIELHRQLKTSHKLFCNCPLFKAGEKINEETTTFVRRLRPSESEMGEVDPAALFEAKRGTWIRYHSGSLSSCLVEADEEPPHSVNNEAIETALIIARMLKAEVVDEIHVMRKIVIDGSNTSGFQRTMVIGIEGTLDWPDGPVKEVGVQTITLEEDAARIIEGSGTEKEYSLDRLGIPLIEVSLSPVTLKPEDAERLAAHLGRLLKSTGRMESGLGTVRQDINVSVMGGGIVEVKGVQQLDMISKVLDFEARRQLWLQSLKEELRGKGLRKEDFDKEPVDISKELEGTKSKIVSSLKSGDVVMAISVPCFKGYFSKEPIQGARMGKELADIARSFRLGGLLHSDELPGYGISEKEVSRIKDVLRCGENDGFVILAGEKEKLHLVFQSLIRRLKQTLDGTPSETRVATPDGQTRFIRPRPGSARMYPETDIEPVPVTEEELHRVDALIPEPWEAQVDLMQKEYSLSYEQAVRVLDSEYTEFFKSSCELYSEKLQPSFIASLLTEAPITLRREGINVDKIDEPVFLELLDLLAEGEVAKEASLDILRIIAKGEAPSPRDAVSKLGLSKISIEELRSIIQQEIERESQLVKSKGLASFSALMGQVMKRVRGRADGALVSRELREALQKRLHQ